MLLKYITNINHSGYQYYIVYACISACIPICVILFYPETMGRSLEEIDVIFRDSPTIMGTVSYAKHKPQLSPVDVPASKHEDVMMEEKA